MKNNKILDIISNISEEYVDEATEMRIKRSQRKGSRTNGALPIKYKIISAVAACLILCMGVVMMFRFLQPHEKSIPIYEGMTVSTDPGIQTDNDITAKAFSYVYMKPTAVTPQLNGKKPIGDAINDSIEIVGGADDIYYADKNSEIYITVHINNPDSFEILSFTLNGQKYTSYMFEENSDLENLVLKINTGDAQGIVDYTIDAIKYIDGTEVKDVRMDGDRTVKVGIRAEIQPAAEISDLVLATDSISFDVTLTDPMHVIDTEPGLLYAVLFDGDNIIKSLPLEMGENSVKFTELDREKSYQYAIVATYEAYDGLGYSHHILAEDTFTTSPEIIIDEQTIKVSNDKITFSTYAYNSISEITLIELINSDGETVYSVTGAENIELVSPKGDYYTVRLIYTYSDGEGSKTDSYTTEPFVVLNGRPLLDGLFAIDPDAIMTKNTMFLRPNGDTRVYSLTDGTVESVSASEVSITDSDGTTHKYSSVVDIQVAKGDKVSYGDVIANNVFDDTSARMDLNPNAVYYGPRMQYRGYSYTDLGVTLTDEDCLSLTWWAVFIGSYIDGIQIADDGRPAENTVWRLSSERYIMIGICADEVAGAKFYGVEIDIVADSDHVVYYSQDEIDTSDPAFNLNINDLLLGAVRITPFENDTVVNLTVTMTYGTASIQTTIPMTLVGTGA